MKRPDLSVRAVGELVDMYIDISVKQAESLLANNLGRGKKLFFELEEIDNMLRNRGLEARKALIPLLDYAGRKSPFFPSERAQVRLNAAKTLLAIVPDKARATLEELATRGPSIQRLSARMCLRHLEEGVYKPT